MINEKFVSPKRCEKKTAPALANHINGMVQKSWYALLFVGFMPTVCLVMI